ncbi:MAG: hypothetical protein CVU97_00765 [Firmicutes bacterium HGW-Firmicutes-21]|nr:MAG: hypothetical protein CVU97_00765 [Firmicutes bacterium HGW-Firmicutes-21]
MRYKNNLAYCGLACCMCQLYKTDKKDKTCVGCRSDGCNNKDWCLNYNCCRDKGINGCWECSDFPCSGVNTQRRNMLDKVRIRAFAEFVRRYGEDELVHCLMQNKENGVVYHYDGQLVGDYDKGETVEEIIEIIKYGSKINTDEVRNHYDSLIDENNDPVYDPQPARDYMDKWDGWEFIDELQLTSEKDVLEIGIGTGRLAIKVGNKCKHLTGIDLSPKTIDRATQNLAVFTNTTLICDDFMKHSFDKHFDVIYSSLTFMHIEDKTAAIKKVASLLKPNGRFVLSVSKSQNKYIDYSVRKICVYPDNPDEICGYIKSAGLLLERRFETEFAFIFTAINAL